MRSIAIIAALTAAIYGCCYGEARTEDVSLRISAAPSIYQATYKKITEEFQKRHPDIKVDLLPPVREDEELLQNTLRSAMTGELPDVLFISPNVMRPLIGRKIAVKLETVGANMQALTNLDLIAGATGVGTVDDTLYGIPFGVSVPIVVYNADLVAKAGGSPEQFPTTWPETIELITKISALEGSLGGFMEYDNTGNWTYKALVATLGGRMMSPDGKQIEFDDAQGQEAFKILQAFGQAGQARADMTRDQARQAFAAGSMGVLITSSGALPALEKQAAGKFSLRAAPLPLGGPEGRIPAAGTVLMITARNEQTKKAAWEFIKFAVGADAQTIMGNNTGLLSVNKTALQDPNRLGNQQEARPNQRAAIAELSRLTEWYAFPGDNSVKITDIIKRYLQAVLTLNRQPEEALASMKKDVGALLK
ncbi:extracellular solute-binding protein [Mesorhizobium sp. WSM3224]|uniref:extracellular solute-binding protein n=1 Tax=Mesorhizobium sp. WSM3224 TaxID=1040986 RepID=UPI0018DE9FA8|nr:extracellular solute-binding protein [Mesorhizobium sp. WSM3224]